MGGAVRHYVPIPTETGYAVAYCNHNGDFRAVMECGSFAAAYAESASLTRAETVATIETADHCNVKRDRFPTIARG